MSKTFPVNITHKPTYCIIHLVKKKAYLRAQRIGGAEAICNPARRGKDSPLGRRLLVLPSIPPSPGQSSHCTFFHQSGQIISTVRFFWSPFLLVCSLPASLTYVMWLLNLQQQDLRWSKPTLIIVDLVVAGSITTKVKFTNRIFFIIKYCLEVSDIWMKLQTNIAIH